MSDGGSVFPVNGGYHAACVQGEGCRVMPGLMIRDHIATQAMAAILSNRIFTSPPARDETAKWAYEYADAMLSARKVAP